MRLPGTITGIETPRLKLRSFTWEDLDELARISADPEVRRYMWAGPLTREQTENNIRQWIEEYEERGLSTLAAVYKPEDRLIGQGGVGFGDEMFGVGYVLDRPYWGMGLATEAASALVEHIFTTFHPEIIRAEARAENAASRRVMEKLGMTHQRTVNHEVGDQVFYTITQEEFSKKTLDTSIGRKR